MTHKTDTRLSHAGNKPEANFGIVNPPVYHASTILFPTVAAMEEGSKNKLDSVYYGRFGTPTTHAFEEAVAELEGGYRCVSYPSGLAAVTGVLLAFLKAGDHILMVDSVYFPTRKFCDGFLKRFGVKTTYYDPMVGAGIAELIRPETKIVFVESPGSLTFEVQDIPAITEAAHDKGCIVVMDNTWSAGYFFKPFEHGVDVSVQAATKFLVGHSDAMLGTAVCTKETFEPVKWTALDLGYCAGPDDCYLGLRGMRTLGTRLRRHQKSGMRLAEWLAGRPEVARVMHPAMPGAATHDLWKRDFTGACGLFGVVLKEGPSKKALAAMLDGFEIFGMGFSWGGYESLMIPTDPGHIRTASSWPDKGPCLRIHTGLEDVDDLIDDLKGGFERLNSSD